MSRTPVLLNAMMAALTGGMAGAYYAEGKWGYGIGWSVIALGYSVLAWYTSDL